ncbi:MAG TPA: ABC transporter permease subunit [Candidatus Aquicultor sp.]
MNSNLLLKSLRDIRVSWISYAAGMVVYVLLLMSIYPTIQKSMADFERLLKAYPKAFIGIFGGGQANLFTVEGFFALEMFALIWFIIIGAFVISYGTGAIGREIDSGTIEILLGQPISRITVLIAKGITLFASTLGLVIVTTGSVYIFSVIYNVKLKPEGVLALTVIGGLFFLAIASFSLLFSVLFGERGRAAFVSAGLLTIMYIIHVLASFADWAKNLDYVSLFHYYDPARLLSTGNIPGRDVAVFVGTIIVFFVASLLIFNRRDIAP